LQAQKLGPQVRKERMKNKRDPRRKGNSSCADGNHKKNPAPTRIAEAMGSSNISPRYIVDVNIEGKKFTTPKIGIGPQKLKGERKGEQEKTEHRGVC